MVILQAQGSKECQAADVRGDAAAQLITVQAQKYQLRQAADEVRSDGAAQSIAAAVEVGEAG